VRTLLVLAAICLSLPVARAGTASRSKPFVPPFGDDELPLTLTEMSPAAVRRMLTADLIDFEEEPIRMGPEAAGVCRRALVFPIPSFQLPLSPVAVAFDDLPARFQLRADERERHADLRARAPEGRLGELALGLERQWFAVRLMDRIYRESWQYELRRQAAKSWYQLDGSLCRAYVARLARDRSLAQAVRGLLVQARRYEQEAGPDGSAPGFLE
jgi:hypothetical protein